MAADRGESNCAPQRPVTPSDRRVLRGALAVNLTMFGVELCLGLSAVRQVNEQARAKLVSTLEFRRAHA